MDEQRIRDGLRQPYCLYSFDGHLLAIVMVVLDTLLRDGYASVGLATHAVPYTVGALMAMAMTYISYRP
eukprot:5403709-Amphidinium_carterae.1